MKALDRKLLRDLWQMRSQVVTVALVVASAFSGFAGSLATYYSLEQARELAGDHEEQHRPCEEPDDVPAPAPQSGRDVEQQRHRRGEQQ